MGGKTNNAYKGVAKFFAFLSRPEIQMEWHTGTGYVPITYAAYEMTKKSGFYEKNPGAEVAIKMLTKKPPTANSKGLRFGNYVQGREVIEEEMEAVFAGAKDAKTALDDAVRRAEWASSSRGEERIATIRREMAQAMEEGCGIYRTEATMRAACEKLADAGIPIGNQTVLLRGVNSSVRVLRKLFTELLRCRVRPYYLFQARPVKAASHFQITLREGINVVRGINARLSGIQKTFKYIMSHVTGKIEILDIGDDGRIYMRYHQNKCAAKIGKLFSRRYVEGACWLDDLPVV
jgi:hypothetical protein